MGMVDDMMIMDMQHQLLMPTADDMMHMVIIKIFKKVFSIEYFWKLLSY